MGDLVLRLSHGPPRYVIGVDNPARWLGCPCGPRNIDLNRHRCPKWSTLDTFHPFVACPDLLLSSVGFRPDSTSQCSSPLVSVGFVSHSIVFVLFPLQSSNLKVSPPTTSTRRIPTREECPRGRGEVTTAGKYGANLFSSVKVSAARTWRHM